MVSEKEGMSLSFPDPSPRHSRQPGKKNIKKYENQALSLVSDFIFSIL